MMGKLQNEVAEIGVRLLDDAHFAWLKAESECEQALRAWCDGSARVRAAAYVSYLAALDREDAAARDLKRLSDITQLCRDSLGRRNGGSDGVTGPNEATRATDLEGQSNQQARSACLHSPAAVRPAPL